MLDKSWIERSNDVFDKSDMHIDPISYQEGAEEFQKKALEALEKKLQELENSKYVDDTDLGAIYVKQTIDIIKSLKYE